MESETWPLRGRLTLGYAFRVLTASRYTLDGVFGALAVRLGRATVVALEHDPEKVNALLGFDAGWDSGPGSPWSSSAMRRSVWAGSIRFETALRRGR